jgi:hypothetical protein
LIQNFIGCKSSAEIMVMIGFLFLPFLFGLLCQCVFTQKKNVGASIEISKIKSSEMLNVHTHRQGLARFYNHPIGNVRVVRFLQQQIVPQRRTITRCGEFLAQIVSPMHRRNARVLGYEKRNCWLKLVFAQTSVIALATYGTTGSIINR